MCVLVQGLGAAAGGVLCVGCPKLWGGVALASAPCTPVEDCCAADAAPVSQPDRSGDDGGDGCGCVDVVLSPSAGTLAQPPVNLLLAPWHLTVAAAVIIPGPDAPAACPPWSARAGPAIVRLLVPAARRTVLLI